MFLNQETSWNKSIVTSITKFLNIKSPTKDDVDSLIMTVTKMVETKLRDTLAIHLGTSVPNDKSYGVRLLDYAVDSHLISSKSETIYSLLYLILKEPRNTSHHTFKTYPYKTIVMFLCEVNEAIERIDSLIKPTYVSYLSTNYYPSTKKIIVEANILRPDMTVLPHDQKAEVVLHFPQGRVKTIPLTGGALNTWTAEYDARGEACGTASCFIRGFDKTIPFVASSGASFVVSYPVGQKCPHCGNEIGVLFTSLCPHCGKELSIT